jgi:hypothetical protein
LIGVRPRERVVCIAEDRLSEEIPLRLLLSSLARHCPDTSVVLTYPAATGEFKEWVERLPGCELRTTSPWAGFGWNVKAYALLNLLAEGFPEVWWIDSDVIVTADFTKRYHDVSPDHVVICEEALYGAYADDGMRTLAWALPPGRAFPHTLNTGVLRVTDRHVALLTRWKEMLEHDAYKDAQATEWSKRPPHLVGDQDVLTALLGSEEAAAVPVHVLHRGRDIIQYFGFFGYTLRERIGNLLHGPPAFIHCQGWKPWRRAADNSGTPWLERTVLSLFLELSPYAFAAKEYEPKLGRPVPWLNDDTRLGGLFRLLGLRHPALTGLPMAACIDVVRAIKGARKKAVHRTPSP